MGVAHRPALFGGEKGASDATYNFAFRESGLGLPERGALTHSASNRCKSLDSSFAVAFQPTIEDGHRHASGPGGTLNREPVA